MDETLEVQPGADIVALFEAARFGELERLLRASPGRLPEAASLLREVVDDSCRAVVLAHLSEHNNTPRLARGAAARALSAAGHKRLDMRVAAARRPTPAVEF